MSQAAMVKTNTARTFSRPRTFSWASPPAVLPTETSRRKKSAAPSTRGSVRSFGAATAGRTAQASERKSTEHNLGLALNSLDAQPRPAKPI